MKKLTPGNLKTVHRSPGFEVNLGLSSQVLKVLNDCNALHIIPEIIKILCQESANTQNLNQEIYKYAIDKAAEVTQINQNENFT